MGPEELAAVIRECVGAAVAQGALDVVVPSAVTVERPRSAEHGDWTTNVALQLANQARRSARDVAQILAGLLEGVGGIEQVDVAGPGFLNIVLKSDAAGRLAWQIVQAGPSFGRAESKQAERINLEFVSANPTGPIHLGGTRWAAVGDSLARILTAAGFDVTREYYFNDHGAQIDRFARSLLARAREEEAPEDGYVGQYIDDIAAEVLAHHRQDLNDVDEDIAQELFRSHGVDLMFQDIKQSLAAFGVDFDVYFHENSVHQSGAVDRAIQKLRDNGHLYELDGALWLRSTDLGDDQDRVIIRSDGTPAYFAGDLAYYLDKRERGFDRVIIMLGADHHGYVGRMMAMCAAFGDTPGVNLEILIGQMVNLVKNGQALRMSKRAGTIVTLEDLLDAVGTDAARYALARSSVDSQIDIDLDLLTKTTNENPVYYVQYAHARTAGVARTAADAGIDLADGFDPSTLDTPTDSILLAALADFPRVVAQAGEYRAPHRVARYLEELAQRYHKWYDACRVTPSPGDPITDLHRSRLCLNNATGQVLANGLGLLGVTAPDRM